MKRRAKVVDTSVYLGPVERWKMLGTAIVMQAVLDWKEADKKQKNPATDNKEMRELKSSAESFLRSDLVEFYSDCSGRALLRKLKAGEI